MRRGGTPCRLAFLARGEGPITPSRPLLFAHSHRRPGPAQALPGGVEALKGVSFQVHRGDRACLLGPNGAGKTTIIRHLAGVLTPDAGTVRLMGAEVGTPAFPRW